VIGEVSGTASINPILHLFLEAFLRQPWVTEFEFKILGWNKIELKARGRTYHIYECKDEWDDYDKEWKRDSNTGLLFLQQIKHYANHIKRGR
jgi:hypothetical protein